MKQLKLGIAMVAVMAIAQMAWADLSSGLVAYYPFDGNASDAIGNGNAGIINGGAVFTTNRFGDANSAIFLDGSDDFVRVPASASLDVGSSPGGFSVALWIKPNDVTSNHPLVEWDDVRIYNRALLASEIQQLAGGTTPVQGRIAYVRYDNSPTLWVFDTVTLQSQQVPLPGTVGAWSARWTPDGEWIVFTGGQGGNTQVYTVRPDGSGLRRITDGNGDLGDPAVCRVDGRIAYEEAYGDIFCINFDGTGLTNLGYGIGSVDWSPGCHQLVGTDWARGGSYNSDLWVWDLTTGAKTNKITSRPDSTAYGRAAWSPDGSKLAAVFSQYGQTDIVLMNPDGSGIVNLTGDWTTSEDYPAWSPDGQFLLFASGQDNSRDIWGMRPDGSDKTKLISGGGAMLISPTMFSSRTNTPPTVVCPAAMTGECGTPVTITVQVADADGDPLTLVWSVNGTPIQTNNVPAGTSLNPTSLSLTAGLSLGTNTVTTAVTDDQGATASCSTLVKVGDTQPPVINGALATPNVLWPPNHQMVKVTVRAQAADACGSATWKIVSVTSNEAMTDRGAGRTMSDWVVLNDREVSLRAERLGMGNGRVYRIALEATDGSGNVSARKVVTVTVPHDMGKGRNGLSSRG